MNIENYQRILEQIAKINPQTQLLAVSKLQPNEKIRELYAQGQRHFAENYMQEATQKIQELKDLKIHWHLIGHLQKNKVKFLSFHFDRIHSVDSLSIAEAINRKASETGLKQKLLLQVNFANEKSKEGFSRSELDNCLDSLKNLDSIDLVGVMCMPPLSESAEDSRPYFKQARELRDQLKKQFINMQELSMGTSSDYLVAAEEGATWLRLGTVLFGERSAKK